MYCTVFYHYFAFTPTLIVTISHPWYPSNVGPSQLQLGLLAVGGGVGPFQLQLGLLAVGGCGDPANVSQLGLTPIRAVTVCGGGWWCLAIQQMSLLLLVL